MPKTRVILYNDDDGSVPLLSFLEGVPLRQQAKLGARIRRLNELGRELRRPETDYLRDGIYELRVGLGHVNYRMLYFFHGDTIAVLTGGLTKEERVPPREIDRAIVRMEKFKKNPKKHSGDEFKGIPL